MKGKVKRKRNLSKEGILVLEVTRQDKDKEGRQLATAYVWCCEIKGEKETRERQAEGDSGDRQPTYTRGRPHPGAPTAYGFGHRGWPDTLPGRPLPNTSHRSHQ